MNHNWRQVRVFTSDFGDHWYFGLLAAFAVPFAAKYPDSPFWVTRYTGDRNNPKDDVADTEIGSLKAPYLDDAQQHRSLRFRFCPSSDEEAFLEALFTDKFWRSGFLPFNALTQFGGSRFCPATEIVARDRRAKLIGDLLYAHSLFVLDTFDGTNAFEENSDSENAFNKSTFHTTLHLMNNACGNVDGSGFHLYLLNKDISTPGGFGWSRL